MNSISVYKLDFYKKLWKQMSSWKNAYEAVWLKFITFKSETEKRYPNPYGHFLEMSREHFNLMLFSQRPCTDCTLFAAELYKDIFPAYY